MATRSQRSAVWEHFLKITEKKVKCKTCDTILSYHGGTTSMKSHLNARHPHLLPSAAPQSTTLHQFVQKKCPAARSKEITLRIAEMVARDLRPISIVNGHGFKTLMTYLEPGYTVPSHTHVSTVCHQLYEAEKVKLASIVKNCEFVGLTTDIWTSATTHAYMTVTIHFVEESWKLSSKVLATQEMPERHTGQHICERLLKITREYSIDSAQITAGVRDNAANAVSGLRLTGWSHFGCAAHTLQLCINSGLGINEIGQMIAVCRKIVGHFKHSVVAMTGLREKQLQLEVPQHSLLQDVSTRWNSTYFMLERLAEQRVAIYAVIHDHSITKPEHRHLDLKDTQWDLLLQMVTVLKPLQMATTVFCSDLNVSCSIIYPVVNGLLYNHLVLGEEDVLAVKNFKKIVAKELGDRFTFPSSSASIAENIPILCSAIDPRYSNLRFLNEEQRKLVYDELPNLMDADETTEEADQPMNKKAKKDCAMNFLLGTFSTNPKSINCSDEIQHFRNEPALDPDLCPLKWWEQNQSRFPRLAKLAKKLMCVPATSVPAERVFSTSGLIVNKLRSSLKPENVDMLVFLNINLPQRSQ